jgi:hypothetical protein
MGSGRYSPDDWTSYASTTSAKPADKIFTSKAIHSYLDPKDITIRESRDSALNPNSTPIILALDVTGSMGMLADNLVKKGLGLVFEEVIDRMAVQDPHMMVMGIGDILCDRAPLQVTQFEAEIKPITEQIEKIFIEHGGGGNDSESYDLAWWFAAMKTSIDSFEKRNKKGYLFTVGDEFYPYGIPQGKMKDKLGETLQADMSADDALELAQRKYHVFHVVIEEGSCARSNGGRVFKAWQDKLGQHVLSCSDHTKLAEIIVSAIQIVEGADADKVISSWKGGTDLVVRQAVAGLTVQAEGAGVTRF